MTGRFTNGLGKERGRLNSVRIPQLLPTFSPTPSHFLPNPFPPSEPGKNREGSKTFEGWEKRRILLTNCSWTIFLKAFPITESCTRSVWRFRQYIFTVTDEVNRYNELKYLRILFFTFPSYPGPLLIMTCVVSWVWADQIPLFLQETRGLGGCIWSLENALFNSSRVDLFV